MTNGPVAFARKPAFLTMLLALAAGLQPGRLRALQPNQRSFKIDLMPQRICASVFALSARYISEFMVEAKIHALWIPATLARLEKFMRGEARQRKVTHHEDEDCPPHCADGSDEVRVVLAIVHAFESRCSREEDCLLTMERGPSVA
jgi:hypothetical protein